MQSGFTPAGAYGANQFSRPPYHGQQPFIPVHEGAGVQQHASDEGEGGSNDMAATDEVQEVHASQVPEHQGKRTGMARRGKAYDPEEDKVICAGWLNTSLDPIVGRYIVD